MKIKKLITRHWPIAIILTIAVVLRLWHLGSNPPHLTPDEASLGYNAYSILKTGKDEYGTTLPIIFKSFGDYKPGLYVYATVPAVALLGLNEFAVRLPSAIAGIIAVALVYLVVKKLFKDAPRLATIAALMVAISPWHIHFSRGAWEINLSLTLTLFGIYFFFRALEKQKYLILVALFFALTLITYQGAKLSTGIVLILLGLLYFKQLLKFKPKYIVISCLAGLIIAIPILLGFTTGQTGRLNVFSVFSYPRPEKYLQDFLDQNDERVGDINYFLFHPEWLNFTRGVMGRYFNHFSARFLFFEGDWQNPRHTAPNMGVLLLADLVLVLLGSLATFKGKISKEMLFVFLWLLLSPLPSVLSRDQVHAVRSYNLVVPIVIITSLGVGYWLSDKRLLRKILLLAFIPLYLVNYAYFLDAYFIHLPKHNSKYWEYGYKQIVETVLPIQNNYKQVTVQQSYAQPYIYFLFYGAAAGNPKYDPKHYQQQAKLKENESGDVGQVEKLGNICFCAIDWSVNRGDQGTLIVGDEVRIPVADSKDEKQFRIVREINYLSEIDKAFRVIEIKNE